MGGRGRPARDAPGDRAVRRMTGPVAGLLAAATIACILANGAIVVADLSRARFVLANSAAVGLSPEALPALAALKGAGAAGLVVGLLGAATLGLVAAVGLVLFYVGAVAVHLRTGVIRTIAFPSTYLLLALGAALHFGAALR